MIRVCKGTCAAVVPSFKGQGGSAFVMHPSSGVPDDNYSRFTECPTPNDDNYSRFTECPTPNDDNYSRFTECRMSMIIIQSLSLAFSFSTTVLTAFCNIF